MPFILRQSSERVLSLSKERTEDGLKSLENFRSAEPVEA